MDRKELLLHHIEPTSQANGPGIRFVIWTQGCHFHCPGCFNSGTFPTTMGNKQPIDQLASTILAGVASMEGITISGGEPLLQVPALINLLSQIKASSDLGVILFTGFEWEEIQRIPDAQDLLNDIDLIIAGRYLQSQRQAHHLIGSTNKTCHFLTSRYSPEDLQIPPAEIIISSEGTMHFSGIDPLIW